MEEVGSRHPPPGTKLSDQFKSDDVKTSDAYCAKLQDSDVQAFGINRNIELWVAKIWSR